MVSTISPVKIAVNTTETSGQENVSKLIKYLNNETLKETPDTFVKTAKSTAGTAMAFEGIPFLRFLKNSKLNHGKAISSQMNAIGEINKKALKNIFKGEGKLTTRIADFVKTANKTKVAYTDLKASEKATAKAAKFLDKIAQKTEAGKKISKGLASKSEKAVEASIKAAEKATDARLAATAKDIAVKSGKFGKFGKALKSSGAGFMLAFSGIIEGFTEVLPTFKELGAKKGVKQLGKSAVKVVGDTAGFIAGEHAGVALGTAIGTAICPGIGSAVGAVCGFIGGLLGSFVAGKITKKITGKSEREIAKEQQEAQQINQIANDEEYLKELKNEVIAKIQQEAELNNGKISEDSQTALQIIESFETQNPFAA